jgi:hypothetical protein
MNEMKKNENIEKAFKNLKEQYRVPDHYFESVENNVKFKELYKKTPIRNFYIKWAVAAVLLIFLGLGFHSLQHKNALFYHPQKVDSILTQKAVFENEEDFFDELDEESVEVYILENGLIDELYLEEEAY